MELHTAREQAGQETPIAPNSFSSSFSFELLQSICGLQEKTMFIPVI